MAVKGRLLVACAGVVSCVQIASAMPTKDEIEKAQPLVAELMASEMEAYRSAGRKQKAAAAVRVANASSEFAKAAETDAAKFLLYRGAVNYYTRGGEYDKAADAVTSLQFAVGDVPPAVIAEITGKATGRISETKAPRLYALYRTAKLQVRACEEAKLLAAKLKKSPSDPLQRRYAEALAVSGDWRTACIEFAKVKDANLQAQIADEANGKAKGAESGDFWWAYEPVMEDAEEFFRSRAVVFYRKALEAGAFTGLKKNLVEKRIASLEPTLAFPVEENKQGASIALDESGKTPSGTDLVIELKDEKGQKIPMTFVPCPAGEFQMGFSNDIQSPWYRHDVRISRKFWIGKYQVTWKQWNVFEKRWRFYGVKEKVFDALGGMDAVMADLSYLQAMKFCEFLTRKYKRFIPKGYVFRLPSEAEWEYAYKANCTDNSDLHLRSFANDKSALREIALMHWECKKQMKAAGIPDEEMPKDVGTPPGRPGQKEAERMGHL